MATHEIDMSACDCCSAGCTGQCSWIWNGASWDFIPNPADDCSAGCSCVEPDYAGELVGELAITSCNPT